MENRIYFRDLTLCNGQLDTIDGKLTAEHIDKLIPLYSGTGFIAAEAWGGTLPKALLQHKIEDTVDRLDKLVTDLQVPLQVLSRGTSTIGNAPFPEALVQRFHTLLIGKKVEIVRVYDIINDVGNLKKTIAQLKKGGVKVDGAVCYSTDPDFSAIERIKALFQVKALKSRIFTKDYMVEQAVRLQQYGVDYITIYDVTGVLTPGKGGRMAALYKERLDVPVCIHSHCSSGLGLATALMAMKHGATIIDTCMLPFAGGNSLPAMEILQMICDKLGIETGMNKENCQALSNELFQIRSEFEDDQQKIPKPVALNTHPDPEVIALMDEIIKALREEKESELIDACNRIQDHFNLPKADATLKQYEIPGLLFEELESELKNIRKTDLMPKVLDQLHNVRLDAGSPPLTAPVVEIIKQQAINSALDEESGKPPYTTKALPYVNLIKGVYGKTPTPVEPDFRYKISGVQSEMPYDGRYYKAQENTRYPEYGDVKLVNSEEEELMLELLPAEAREFYRNKLEQAYMAEIYAVEEQKRLAFEAEKQAYEALSDEEKEKRLLSGLYNYEWSSDEEIE